MEQQKPARMSSAPARYCIAAAFYMLSACAGQPAASGIAASEPAAPATATKADPEQSPLDQEARLRAERLYLERCATCHDAGRAPPRSRLETLSPREILEALDTGFMAAISQFMSADEKMTLVRHLAHTGDT